MLMWDSLHPKQRSRSQFVQPILLDPQIFTLERPKSTFLERILFSSIPAVGEAQKPDRKAKRVAGNVFFDFLRNFRKI